MKKTVICLALCAVMLISMGIIDFASGSGYTMVYFPGTEDTVSNMPEKNGGTGGEAYTVSSVVPEREGYEFICWELDHAAEYYEVTYAVNPDPVYGLPEDFTVPTDPGQYIPGDEVTVAGLLTSTQDHAINSKTAEVRPGHWEFVPWDKADFEIYGDTTITGEWKFISKFKCVVHYLDDSSFYQLADDDVIWLDVPEQVTVTSKVYTEFYPAYQKRQYYILKQEAYLSEFSNWMIPGMTYVKNKSRYEITFTPTEENTDVFFFYHISGKM